MELNNGAIVEHAIRRQNVNISELSRRMKVNRKTLYNWFQNKKLDTEVIRKIGQVINYDFSNDLHISLSQDAENDFAEKAGIQSDSPDSIYYWMEKYISLLEDYKRLLKILENHDVYSQHKFKNWPLSK